MRTRLILTGDVDPRIAHTGHGGRAHGDWIGMMVRADVEKIGLKAARFQFVRHNADIETTLCALADEPADIVRPIAEFGATLTAVGDDISVAF